MGGIMMMNMSHKPAAAAGGGGTSMRALLSVSGQTAFDAASNDSWFNVSSSDYAAVFNGLAGTTKVGMPDSDVTAAAPTAFVGSYGITLPQANATVPVGNYVIGFVFRGYTATAATVRPYISTTFKGTYTTLGANVISASASASPLYYLRKNPASAAASTSYVALGPRSSGNWAATGTYAGAGYSANMSSWTLWNTNTPIHQFLITTTAP